MPIRKRIPVGLAVNFNDFILSELRCSIGTLDEPKLPSSKWCKCLKLANKFGKPLILLLSNHSSFKLADFSLVFRHQRSTSQHWPDVIVMSLGFGIWMSFNGQVRHFFNQAAWLWSFSFAIFLRMVKCQNLCLPFH